jgi:hypothetical protein
MQWICSKVNIDKAFAFVKQSRVEPSSEDSNRTSGVGSLVDSKLSYLIMIPTIFIRSLKLTRPCIFFESCKSTTTRFLDAFIVVKYHSE